MRLIDAEGSFTLNAVDNTGYSLCFGGGIISVTDRYGRVVCEFFADDTPAVEATPVRYGHWKRRRKHLGECSECGEVVSIRYKYCPNCGAKMDREGGEYGTTKD